MEMNRELGAEGAARRPSAPSGQHGDAIVRARRVQRSFGARSVLGGVDLDIRAGEFVALLGASGSGKSTLLRVIAGLDRHASGELSLPVRSAVVFQEPRLLPWKRVWRNVALGLPAAEQEARQRALAALEEVGLRSHADAWPSTLSGGEAQRVALARALVREPELLLLDEPFGALDALTRIKMHRLLRELCRKHRPAVLLVTHDVEEAVRLADRALVLAKTPAPAGAHGAAGAAGATIVVDLDLDLGAQGAARPPGAPAVDRDAPAPRGRTSRRFAELCGALLGHLGVEGDELSEGDPPAARPSSPVEPDSTPRRLAPAEELMSSVAL